MMDLGGIVLSLKVVFWFLVYLLMIMVSFSSEHVESGRSFSVVWHDGVVGVPCASMLNKSSNSTLHTHTSFLSLGNRNSK